MEKAIISVPTLSNKENITNGSLASALILKAFKEATFIPNNATNGDIIKALFYVKDVEEMECCTFVSIAGDADMRVYKDWWNAPYETESEDEE